VGGVRGGLIWDIVPNSWAQKAELAKNKTSAAMKRVGELKESGRQIDGTPTINWKVPK
jgi:hypothetical protein